MITSIMEATTPVIAEMVKDEILLGEHQEKYITLPALFRDQMAHTRWRLSAEDLAAILDGGDILLSTLTFGQPFQPIKLRVITSSDQIVGDPIL